MARLRRGKRGANPCRRFTAPCAVAMTKVLIIADDLSGAADCASAFAQVGFDTLVMFGGDAAQADSASVLAIDADSRRLPASKAARIHQALHGLYHVEGALLYKKVDSTLRGNFAEELAAIAASAGLAIVAPAFPKAGRTTLDGCQYLHGAPLEQSEVWRVEGMGGAADIPAMLERQGLRTAAVHLSALRQATAKVAALLESLAGDGMHAVVCDVETDDDLRLIAQASLQLRTPCFWVGSAGLAAHLATAVSQTLPAVSAASPKVDVRGGILTVVGSMSSISREQARQLGAATRIVCLEVAVSVLRGGPLHAGWLDLQQHLGAALAQGRDLLLTIVADAAVDLDEGVSLCHALAQLVAPLAAEVGALIATGGETARALLCAMGYYGLRLAGEIEAGVPLSMAAGPRALAVITKAGAFGNGNTLLNCYQALSAARRSTASRLPNPHPTKGH
jgi:uncharacterized protein YgbK (DUF1537 family)